jgi:Flp pilus assembly protein TadG
MFRNNSRAVAAVEFALLAPFLAAGMAGATDYGFRQWSRSCLANAVAQGAYYAFRTGPTVTAANVTALVQSASSLSGVVVARMNAPTQFCPSGAPAALGTKVTTTTCPDGSTPGTYMVITATYNLITFMPNYSGLGGSSITESVTVRLQ